MHVVWLGNQKMALHNQIALIIDLLSRALMSKQYCDENFDLVRLLPYIKTSGKLGKTVA